MSFPDQPTIQLSDLTPGKYLCIIPRMILTKGDLSLLHKGLAVRRPDLHKVVGTRRLTQWGLHEDELFKTKVVVICHLETIIAEFSDGKTKMTARYGYNIEPGLASTLLKRLDQLSERQGPGYSKPTTSNLLGTITAHVNSRLNSIHAPPAQDHIQLVEDRERGRLPEQPQRDSTTPAPPATELRNKIITFNQPSDADTVIKTFLRSTVYAPRPQDVGYVVRKTKDDGYIMCVFSSEAALKAYQQIHDPRWSRAYLALTGQDLVAEVIERLPPGVMIMVDPGLVGDDKSASLSLPHGLILELYNGS